MPLLPLAAPVAPVAAAFYQLVPCREALLSCLEWRSEKILIALSLVRVTGVTRKSIVNWSPNTGTSLFVRIGSSPLNSPVPRRNHHEAID